MGLNSVCHWQSHRSPGVNVIHSPASWRKRILQALIWLAWKLHWDFLWKWGQRWKKIYLDVLFKNRKLFEGQCSCPFSGTSPSSCQGEHPLFLFLIKTKSREPTLCKVTGERCLQWGLWAWPRQQPLKDSFTQVFLTPVDMTKLKIVENCLLKTLLQTVCLNSSRVLVPQHCPDVALSPQGPQRALKGWRNCFSTKPSAVVLAVLHYSRNKTTTFLLLFCFVLFYFMEVTAFAEKWLNLQISQVKWYNCPLNILVCTGWAPTFTAWMRWRITSLSLTYFEWRNIIYFAIYVLISPWKAAASLYWMKALTGQKIFIPFKRRSQ